MADSVLDSPAQPELRDLNDPVTLRRQVYDRVLHAASNLPPLTNQRHTLALSDVHYADDGEFDLAAQKQAILERRSLGRKLSGTWLLSDNATGQVLDKRRQILARVPFVTDRGTFIHNGNDWSLVSQLRLRPGVFTRQNEAGDFEAHANIMPGTGLPHRYFLDPEKGTFHVRLGQAKLPLLPLMKALGATPQQLKEAWGGDLVAANAHLDDPQAIRKYYQRLVRNGQAGDSDSMRQALSEQFSRMALDPEISRRTLGHPYDRMDLPAMLAVTKKLLAVSRGEADVDDRDDLANQTIHGAEDTLAERLTKDAGGLRRQLLWKASFRGNLRAMPSGALHRQLEGGLLSSGLGNVPEESNPLEILDKQTRVTRMGVGAIGSLDAVPDEARALQPSHMGLIDPTRTPESSKAGIDLNIAGVARKGSDNRLYTPLLNARTGRHDYISAQDLANKAIAFPESLKSTDKRVPAMYKGGIRYLPREQIDFVLPNFEDAFSPLANLIPFKSGVKGQRVSMGSRMLTQSLPLVNPESPWVQNAMPDNPAKSYFEHYSSLAGALHAKQGGRIEAVAPGAITFRGDDGHTTKLQLYDAFPYNRKTEFYQTPLVKPGQRVEAGELLARSNFTDKKGVLAVGLNARVGYLPFEGGTFEDAIAVSESMAKRLTSEHLQQRGLDWTDKLQSGKAKFIGLFPSHFDRKAIDQLDSDGVIKVGSTVMEGQPIALAVEAREITQNRIHRRQESPFMDRSDIWDHSQPGTVMNVTKHANGVTVLVRSTSPMKVADKISGLFGDKGVISRIIPDDLMPHDAQGRPLEILVDPLGVISRTNPAQVVEAALGKIAASTGKTYKVQDFKDTKDLVEFARDELRKHNMQDLEDVTDPATGRKIPGVLVGNRYFLKLHHMSEDKLQARSTGGYTASEKPARAGEHKAKQLSLLETNALLSHGAYDVLRDATSIRGSRNEDYWLAFLKGDTPPPPKVPLAYKKFLAQLEGAGVHVQADGPRLRVMALTDKDVDRLAGNREVRTADTLDPGKKLAPISGGLFDPKIFGEQQSQRWGKVTLEEALPNPVMEEPIRRLLGLTEKQFTEVLSGQRAIKDITGPKAIAAALDRIDLPKALAQARAEMAGSRKGVRDDAIRKLAYLRSAQELGLHPRDWMLSQVPVLPPIFRPVSVMADTGLPLVSDANYMYRELIEANKNLREMRKRVSDTGEEQLALYQSFKAVTGLDDPVHPQLVEKGVRGLLKEVFGKSPKYGAIQRQLLSTPVDLVGRGVVSPDQRLDMDHVGLPEDMAWNLYKPFIARRLRRNGLPIAEALTRIEDRKPEARQELLAEMSHRPVIVSRSPVWHRFGILAFYPKLVAGNSIRVSPLVTTGFNMDFDGDQANLHLPVAEAARLQTISRMLPSANLFSAADFRSPMPSPTQAYTGGLYAATTQQSKRKANVYATKQDAIKAYHRGDINVDDAVEILS